MRPTWSRRRRRSTDRGATLPATTRPTPPGTRTARSRALSTTSASIRDCRSALSRPCAISRATRSYRPDSKPRGAPSSGGVSGRRLLGGDPDSFEKALPAESPNDLEDRVEDLTGLALEYIGDV